ncbi:MAG: hypothetical protein HY545_00665 [Candidatus Doudnabacteria bacterium]|nr:hypothetical protein [Candidatus Doudnabacteria bacterium]
MPNKKSQHYGSFAVKQKYFGLPKKTAATLGSIIVVGLLMGLGLAFYNSSQKQELVQSFVPQAVASDIPGWWYKQYFDSSVCEKDLCKPEADPDNDKLTNAQEFYFHSNPLNRDTNGNGLTDGEDVAYNYDPSKPGKVTFDEAASDESILGESLVFNEDINKILNETVDPSQIRLPEIKDQELKVLQNSSKEAVTKYLQDAQNAVSKYFSADSESYIQTALDSEDQNRIEDLKLRAARTLIELKAVETPEPALQFHKYTIMFFQLLPYVITTPPPQILESEVDPQSNLWFDQAQAFFLVNQKMDIEVSKLQTQYK